MAVHAPQITKPDLRFGYDYAGILATLSAFGQSGRQAYAVNLVIDTIMPVLFAAATILVVARAVPRWLGVLAVAPAAFLLLDLIENASFAVMLVQYPEISPAFVAATNPMTVIKLSSFIVALPTLVLGIIALGIGWLRRRA